MAGKTLDNVGNKFSSAEIVHQGEKVILPESMTLEQAIDLLKRRKEYMEQTTEIVESFDAFPYDGAAALERVLKTTYGWAPQTATPGFFGPKPPQMISVEVGLNSFIQVPWGRFELPNIRGFIQTTAPRGSTGRFLFGIQATVLRADEKIVNELFNKVRTELKEHSIYRGQAIKIAFNNDKGEALPMPSIKFLDTEIDQEMLIFSQDVQDAVETNLFTPLERLEDCERAGIAFKRGVLLGGVYGTGKTLAAKVASKLAKENGITFVYIHRADELGHAVEFARQYQSPACAIFCEDIDRVLDGDRDDAMDTILNTIDGIDAKTSRIMVILTTNAVERINPAMLRPGRLDAVINVTPPDAKAVEKILRAYGKTKIDETEDLSEAGAELSGQVPAVIGEVVKRAHLAQLRRLKPGQLVKKLSGAALAEAARTMRGQIELLSPKPPVTSVTLEQQVAKGVKMALADTTEKVDGTHETVKKVAKAVGAVN